MSPNAAPSPRSDSMRATTRSASCVLVVALDARDRLAGAELAPELLREQLRVVADHRVRGGEDAAGRAVVLLERDHLQARVVGRQALQVLDRRAAPAVDALVVVADRGEAAARPGDQLHQLVLHAVGVLVFVDQDVARAVRATRRARRRALRGGARAARSGRRSRSRGTRRGAPRSGASRARRRARRRSGRRARPRGPRLRLRQRRGRGSSMRRSPIASGARARCRSFRPPPSARRGRRRCRGC